MTRFDSDYVLIYEFEGQELTAETQTTGKDFDYTVVFTADNTVFGEGSYLQVTTVTAFGETQTTEELVSSADFDDEFLSGTYGVSGDLITVTNANGDVSTARITALSANRMVLEPALEEAILAGDVDPGFGLDFDFDGTAVVVLERVQ
ncbi:hypothetical protein [Croceiramulus getboli]|nr:hypothetical protein P8624_03620 [Flavobacteriaceae bacterium YJPT1-3]